MSAPIQDSPDSIHATAAPNSSIVLQIDKSLGKQFMLILWITSFVSALATLGLFLAWQGMRYNIAHTNVLQYDLMDLRAKTGHAHENTPEPEPTDKKQ